MAAPVLKKYFQTYTTDANGLIDLTGILSVQAHNTVSVEMAQFPLASVTMTVECDMGLISGPTLSSTVAQYPLGNGASPIQTFNVAGPEFRVLLTGGPPNTAVPIQGWVFVR